MKKTSIFSAIFCILSAASNSAFAVNSAEILQNMMVNEAMQSPEVQEKLQIYNNFLTEIQKQAKTQQDRQAMAVKLWNKANPELPKLAIELWAQTARADFAASLNMGLNKKDAIETFILFLNGLFNENTISMEAN